VTKHRVLVYEGPASDWYRKLFDEIMSNHREVPCTQGVGLESPHSLVAVIEPADSCIEAFASVDLPRAGDPDAKLTFSLLYSLRRILGYHETVLFDKYPILRRYVDSRIRPFYARPTSYLREEVPDALLDQPWVSKVMVTGREMYAIDQIGRAVSVLADPKRRGSRTCLVDFGDGFKSRCIMSWLFTIRDGQVDAYNHVRSNDLLVGMPNDLIDVRLCQLIIAAGTGMAIGYLTHQSSIVQAYRPDVAGRDQVRSLIGLLAGWHPESHHLVIARLRGNRILQDIISVIEPCIGSEVHKAAEGWHRYQAITCELRHIFWSHNTECAPENRLSVRDDMCREREGLSDIEFSERPRVPTEE
jgi:hypothetical protein